MESDSISMQSRYREPSELNADRIRALRRSPLTAPEIVGPPPGRSANVSFEANICSDCCLAISDAIMQTHPVERWVRLKGTDAAIAVYRQHHSNATKELFVSASSGCEMCALMHRVLDRYRGGSHDREATYSIFVKLQPVDKCLLRLCTGEVSRFSRSMEGWEKSQDTVLRFFSAAIPDKQAGDHFTPGHSLQCLQATLLHLQALPDQDSGGERNIETIRAWQKVCDENHSICQKYRQAWHRVPMPKRLVDISAMNTTGKVHLCFPKPEDMWPYATVTYSWGRKGENKRVMTKNNDPAHPDFTEASRVQGTDVRKFPDTLRDAMRLAQKLNIRYLWIDSLCIVQDDQEKDGKEQVAALIQIYSKGDLNLSAASGLRSEHGMLRHIKQHGVCVGRAGYSTDRGENPHPRWQQLIYAGTDIPVVNLEEMESGTRAWIFQERLVSSATVHFTDAGLIWECAEHISLNREQFFTNSKLKSQWAALMGKTAPESLISASSDTQEMVSRYWNEWVAAYAARDIGRSDERLVAYSSMAEAIRKRFGLHPIAGAWWEDIVNSLLWSRDHPCECLRYFDHDDYPSWSWTSVTGRLNFVRQPLITKCKHSYDGGKPFCDDCEKEIGQPVQVIGTEISDEKDSTKSKARERLKLHGSIQKVTIDQWLHPGTGQRDSQAVGVVSGFINAANVMVLLDVPTKSIRRYESYWFLRVGAYPDGDRKGDLFLILEQLDEEATLFKRLGFARTEPWFDSGCVTLASGKFVLPQEKDLILT